MKEITVGQLRQNPTDALSDVEAGASYRITRHNREIGWIVPAGAASIIPAPRRSGGARTRHLPRLETTAAGSLDVLLEEQKGDW